MTPLLHNLLLTSALLVGACSEKSAPESATTPSASSTGAQSIELICGNEKARKISIEGPTTIDDKLCAEEWAALSARAAGREELLRYTPERRLTLRKGASSPVLEIREAGRSVRQLAGVTQLRLVSDSPQETDSVTLKILINGREEVFAGETLAKLMNGRRKRDLCALADDLGSRSDSFAARGDDGAELSFSRKDCVGGGWILKQGKRGLRLRGQDGSKLLQTIEHLQL